MTDFVTDTDIVQRVRDLIDEPGDAFLISAFWGKGAPEKLLGSSTHMKQVRAICNLALGGTNPDAVQDLLDRGVYIRHNSNLHAKVYASAHRAIVGSANASANGLGFEDEGSTQLYEAAIEVSDPNILADINSWAQSLWDSAATKEITKHDLKLARKAWERRRIKGRIHRNRNERLLDVLQNSPDDLRDRVVFAVYNEEESDLSKAAKGYIKDRALELQEEQPQLAENLDGYENWREVDRLLDGVDIIDLCFDRWGNLNNEDVIWRVYGDSPVKDVKGASPIKLAYRPPDFAYRLPKRDIRVLEKAGERIWKEAYPGAEPFEVNAREGPGVLSVDQMRELIR
ncbi:phospholipase D family protein [Halofilum ochraceum]|uniref:phospholipase D family protein n=1 Tax=Halofilum ochraceum TaxID=1611323 RepID=UPI0011131AEC|nr:phospholipase D family protein [Halofilum ochraceum]